MSGVSRCMNRSWCFFRSTPYQSFPTLGARKKNTVSIVTVTAAVPIYFRIHTHCGTSPASRAIPIARAEMAHRTLLWQVKNRNAYFPRSGAHFPSFRQNPANRSSVARKITRFRITSAVFMPVPPFFRPSGPAFRPAWPAIRYTPGRSIRRSPPQRSKGP